jgi:hypothetical protein
MKFPREVWAGSHLENARQPRRLVVENKEEFVDFVEAHNGKMNVFTNFYDFDNFYNNRGLEDAVVYDRLFLDIDAHDDKLEEAYDICYCLQKWLVKENILHRLMFSGRGFYIFIFGERVSDLRCIRAFFNICKDVVGGSDRLDAHVINASRLRRVANTYNFKAKRFCINLTPTILERGLLYIMNLSKNPRNIPVITYGENLVSWPDVSPIEAAEVEIEYVDSIGKLPVLPCLKNSIMTENPSHRIRYLLVQWYNEMLSEMCITDNELNCTPREITGPALNNISDQIEEEIKKIASHEDVWIDYNENITRDNVEYIVRGRYMAPSCDTLIREGLCVGKCWRYPDAINR